MTDQDDVLNYDPLVEKTLCDACHKPGTDALPLYIWKGAEWHALCAVCQRLEAVGLIDHWGALRVQRQED